MVDVSDKKVTDRKPCGATGYGSETLKASLKRMPGNVFEAARLAASWGEETWRSSPLPPLQIGGRHRVCGQFGTTRSHPERLKTRKDRWRWKRLWL